MIRRKKLFLYVPSLIAGGAERVAMLLAEGFVRQGRDVFLIVAKNVGEFANAPPEAVSVIDLACEKPIKGIADLAHQIRLHRPDACIDVTLHIVIDTLAILSSLGPGGPLGRPGRRQ